MHGVPADLPLAFLVGCTLDQIGVGQFQLQFHFSGEGGYGGGRVSVEGHWELHDAKGAIVDTAMEHFDRKHYTIHVILGRTVSKFTIDPPRSFTLFFDSGHRLTVYDDDPHYETFSVTPAGEQGVYV